MPVQTLDELCSKIAPADKQAAKNARQRWDNIAKPLRSLGLFEEAIIRIAGITGNADKISLDKRCNIVMCGDNGVLAEGVTQSESDITAVIARHLAKGIGSVSVFGRKANCRIMPVDMGMVEDVDEPNLLKHKLAHGTANIAAGPAMTMEQAIDGVLYGASLVERLAGEGYNIITTGEMGIGNTTTSSAIACVLLGKDAGEVTGRGAGLTSDGLKRKISAIERAVAVNKITKESSPMQILACLGGFDIAGLVGVFLGGAAYHIPIVIDGFISSISALLAQQICPVAHEYWIASHCSKEPAGEMTLNALGLRPLITADLCLGEGTGAVASLPLLDIALAYYREMGTFDDIAIEHYVPLS